MYIPNANSNICNYRGSKTDRIKSHYIAVVAPSTAEPESGIISFPGNYFNDFYVWFLSRVYFCGFKFIVREHLLTTRFTIGSLCMPFTLLIYA